MKRDPALGNAFMDIAFTGALLSTIALVVDFLMGGGADLGLVALGAVTYGSYLIGAVRLGVSPLDYVRNLTKRTTR